MKGFMVISLFVVTCQTAVKKSKTFPADFMFGTATASYQIEGAWNEGGKGENIWDYMVHNKPNLISDQSNGDIAAKSYHNYKRDVEMMRELGIDSYRFSFSWTRILPSGFVNEINPAGIEFYNNYINEMLKYGITPMATMYHWDLPQKLQELGGFANPMISDWFEQYARVLYDNFGDRVKHWITFNEPGEICFLGYGSTIKAPALNSTAVGTYLCAKHLVMAHAKAYHTYNNDFKPTQCGECGITISVNWYGPVNDTAEDMLAAEIRRQGEWGIYAEPIFSADGGFPKEFSQRVAEKSTQQGYPWSRLPCFSGEEKDFVKGSADFFGLNHYTGLLVSAKEYKTGYETPSLLDDMDVGSFVPKEWLKSVSSWLTLSPNSIYNVIKHLNTKYNSPVFYITESGWSTGPDRDLQDDDRIAYYTAALENVLDLLDEGVNLKGYMAWSLMDNFEWMQGYTERFGLYYVDFKDPVRRRTPRKSAFFYKHIIKNRYIDFNYEIKNWTMTIDQDDG